jgi:DNA-binding SARP family transcriptional activator
MLWPDLTIEDAAPRLHKAAHYARRALGGPGTIVLAAESVTLFPHEAVRVDAMQFQDLADMWVLLVKGQTGIRDREVASGVVAGC